MAPAYIQNTPPLFDRWTENILIIGWMMYIILAPLYFFKSGIPQIADYIILVVAAMAIILFFIKQVIIFNRVFAALALMVLLFFSINVTNFIFYRDFGFLFASVYYVFNSCVFMVTVILFKSNTLKMMSMARIAIFISLVLEVVWLQTMPSNSIYRDTGSFNNPNQLGYWALLCGCYILVLNYGRKMKWYDVLGFILSAYLASEALSRAVIVSYGLIFIAFLCGKYVSVIVKIAMALIVAFYALFQITLYENPAFLIENFESIERIVSRLESIQTEEGVLEERGYQRIINYSQYLFFGAGEGYYTRFKEFGGNPIELHSGLGTILFSYGIMGFILFCTFVGTIFQRAPFIFWVMLAAIMAYGVTHQHVRFTGFWVFMGLVYAMTRYVIPHQASAFFRPRQPHHPLSLTTTNADRSI